MCEVLHGTIALNNLYFNKVTVFKSTGSDWSHLESSYSPNDTSFHSSALTLPFLFLLAPLSLCPASHYFLLFLPPEGHM